MQKSLFILICCFLYTSLIAQISYESGYIIDHVGQKTICLIKNVDWKNTPSEISYKLSDEASVIKAGVDEIKEFGIGKDLKYISASVQMDYSKDKINRLSDKREVDLVQEVLFLKSIVEGKAHLYTYTYDDIERYFYSIDDGKPSFLIYKKYKSGEYRIRTNDQYKLQLWDNLKCDKISLEQINAIDYKQKELSKLFKKYNACHNVTGTAYDQERVSDIFNFTIKPGVNYSNFLTPQPFALSEVLDLAYSTSLRIGLEVEYIFPFNKRKWTLFTEPAYYSYQNSGVYLQTLPNDIVIREIGLNLKVKAIELPIGLRYHLFTGQESRIFTNAMFYFDIPIQNEIVASTGRVFNFSSRNNFGLGMGLGYRWERYSVEARYKRNVELSGTPPYWGYGKNTVSIILGYTFYRK